MRHGVLLLVVLHDDQSEFEAALDYGLDAPGRGGKHDLSADQLGGIEVVARQRAAPHVDGGTDRVHAGDAAILDADALGVVDHRDVVAGRANGEDRQLAEGLVHWMERHGVEVDHRWCKHVQLDPEKEKVQIKMDRGEPSRPSRST
jgi:hypothetical protein